MTAVNPPAYIQAASHPADVFRRAIQTAMRGGYGVVQNGPSTFDLLVTANGTPNMTVNVAAGRAIIPGTQNTLLQAVYEALNDATVNLTISASHPTLPRNDLVVASVQDAAYSGGSNQWLLQVITGTAAASPADPSVPSNSITLARVRVDAAVTSIVSGKITDLRPALAGTATYLGQVVGAGGNNGGVGQFSAQSRFLGMLAAAGAPTSGTYNLGDWGFDSNQVPWICTAAGSPGTWRPMAGTYQVAETTPTGTTTSFTLPTWGRHAFWRIQARGTDSAAQNVYAQFNGDGAANYSWMELYSTGTAGGNVPSAATAQPAILQLPGSSAAAGETEVGEIQLLNYRDTTSTWLKVMRSWAGYMVVAGGIIAFKQLYWNQGGAAVSSVLFGLVAGSYVSGSRFTLYVEVAP